MNSSREHIDLFDAYLDGTMPAANRSSFERELDQNPDLKKEFEEYASFAEALKEGSEYGDIQAQLNRIHGASGKSFFLSKRFYVSLSLVAGFTLLFLVLNPFNRQANETAANDDYQYLKNEEATEAASEPDDYAMDTVSLAYESYAQNTEEQIMKEPEFLAPRSANPVGTAFLVSDEGYFLTSRHLVDGKKKVILQQKDLGITFEAQVVYQDSLEDLAILVCHPQLVRELGVVPFRFGKRAPELWEEVFTLGYPKKEIVYTQGVVSSETGYKSDSLSFEVSLPANPGYSGAPLFTCEGELIGIISGNNLKQQSVTYVLDYTYISAVLSNLSASDSVKVDMSKNKYRNEKRRADLVKRYRKFVFEVHLK